MPSGLPADTRMGAVALTVRDLEAMATFYERVVGLKVLARDGARINLGAPDATQPLVELHGAPDAPKAGRVAGLFHLAVLLPERADLGLAVRRVIEQGWRLSGASDHFVSEAIYLRDPEGNGIEIYRDYPKADWPMVGEEIQIGTEAMDMEGVLAAAGDTVVPPDVPAGTVMGHVHLSIGDLEAVEHFYREVVGFDRIITIPGQASFLSAGGYHHHLGMNTWAGTGLTAPPLGVAGLRSFEIVVPSGDERTALLERAGAAGALAEETAVGVMLRDPAGLTALLPN